MLGGCACQDPGDALQAQRLAQAAGKGAAAVAAGHAAHAGDPAAVARCHARLCALPEKGRRGPGHDPAACHAAMTGGIGVFVADAGYHSAANLEAPGPGRLFADAKARDLARREPAAGPARRRHRRGGQRRRLATPEGRALYKRRAPDVEGLHASLKDDGGLRRFSLRGLHNATSEFLFAGLAHNLRLLASISRTPAIPAWPRSARPGRGTPSNISRIPQQQHNGHLIPTAEHAPGPNPGPAPRPAAAKNCNSPPDTPGPPRILQPNGPIPVTRPHPRPR